MKKYGMVKTRYIHHEGDERSRTHPGHGYPARTEEVTEFRPFKDREEMVEWVNREESRIYGKPDKYTIIEYTELNITKTVNINIPE